ncbi:MAG: porin, gram-negative type, partial [Burkholderiales bacterium]|nr:porin, gram-negative type [Burkholderiales bacterium]
MKNRNLILMTCAALSTAALAQSSVTLSGVADVSLRHVRSDGLGSVTSLASGANSTSRIRFAGIEDLGGGLNAAFVLESGINMDNGSIAGNFFDRESHVSLNSKSWGSLRVGRDYTSAYRNWGARYDPMNYVGAGAGGNLVNANSVGPIRDAF